MQIQIETSVVPPPRAVEIVERKGLGHPDTIADHLSECFSVALSRYYVAHFGLVLHHNVDKALIAAGQSAPDFGGGTILKPFDLYLAGRATAEVRGAPIPVEDIAHEATRTWLRDNLHAFDVNTGVRIHCVTRPGSPELVDLFLRQRKEGLFLANDTSIGTGFAPLSELERIVLAVEQHANSTAFKSAHPETGEDIKVMGLREGERIALTVSCAMIGLHLNGIEAYRAATAALAEEMLRVAQGITRLPVAVRVNAADDIESGAIYLTVGGTSAECGDDGETGRGNRANGLITPFRPMTMEAMAGKNPITHVGKLYNAAASRIAARIVDDVSEISSCECFLVSEIGRPIQEPRLAHLKAGTKSGRLSAEAEKAARRLVGQEIAAIPRLWTHFIEGSAGYV